jgi:hypothetical protein
LPVTVAVNVDRRAEGAGFGELASVVVVALEFVSRCTVPPRPTTVDFARFVLAERRNVQRRADQEIGRAVDERVDLPPQKSAKT